MLLTGKRAITIAAYVFGIHICLSGCASHKKGFHLEMGPLNREKPKWSWGTA